MSKTARLLVLTLLFSTIFSGMGILWGENKAYAEEGTAPAFAAYYPGMANVTGVSLDLQIKMNKAGTAYYEVYDVEAPAPGSSELKDNGVAVQVTQPSAEIFIISLNSPVGVAIDGEGNIYVADKNNKCVRKYDPEGHYIREWTGFDDPWGVSVDNEGNIYVSDNEINGNNPLVKKYNANGGFVCEWGGKGTGDGQFDEIRGLAVDNAGYVYVAQWNNSRVQKFTTDGTHVATWGSYGSDDGQFKNPTGVAVDRDGNVYVADYWNHRVQKLSAQGVYIAKWGSEGKSNGQFYKPSGIAIDPDGNVYVADYGNHRVQKLSASGGFLAKWGKDNCTSGLGEEEFNGSYALAADASGNVYVADRGNNRIQKLAYKGSDSISGGLEAGRAYDIYVVAEDSNSNLQGQPKKMAVTMDAAPAFAEGYPQAVNATGSGLDLLIKMNEAGKAYYEVFEVEEPAPGSAELKSSGNLVQVETTSAETVIAGLNWPEGVAVDRNGNIYVADTNSNRVVKYDPQGTLLYEWTGFNKPRGVAVDVDGNLYVADTENHQIKKYGTDGTLAIWGKVDCTAGTGNGEFNQTRGVAVDNAGHVYVVEYNNNRVQKFTADGDFITKWGSYGTGDGQFKNPTGLAVDSRNGHVYVADYWNHRIQKFTAQGVYLDKWGKADCTSGTGNGEFYNPAGIVVDADGNVYVAEYRNHRVQKLSASGGFLAKWGRDDCTSGTGEEEFNGSNGLAMDGAGDIYVTDRTNSRIQKLAYKASDSIADGLEAGNSYDIYIAAEDAKGNLQPEPVKVTVTMDSLEVATPQANPPAGIVVTGTTVTLSCATAGATIYYTTDGSDPTSGSTLYTGPITIDAAMTIKAIAAKEGLEDSGILTAAYTTVTGDEVFVSTSGNDDNDGYSWHTAKLTIKQAIDTVTAGGTVYIADGVYAGEDNRSITIDKDITIQGQSQNGAIIDGGNSDQVFAVGSGRNVAIQNVTITKGSAYYGAVSNSGNLTINECTLKDNTAMIEGGAIRNAGTLIVNSSTFMNNAAPITTSGSGGAIYNTGAMTINDSNFTDNTAKYGGAIHNRYPSTVNNSTFHSNNAWYSDGYGGAIYSISQLTLNGCTFESNSALNGGAVYNGYESVLNVTGSTFKDNNAFYNGGAIHNNGSLRAHFCRFLGNTPQDLYRGAYADGSADAEYNWWGSNVDPSARVAGGIVVNNWLVLNINANPTAAQIDETSTITADLLHDQTGAYYDPAGGHVPDGIAVIFNTTDDPQLGSLHPLSGVLADGQAASTFTAGAFGTATITATVDNQAVSAQITILPEHCILTYTAGDNGSIVGDTPQTVSYGGSGTEVTAAPDPGYHFVNWSDGVTTASRTDTDVTEDLDVTAYFAQNQKVATPEADPPAGEVPAGKQVALSCDTIGATIYYTTNGDTPTSGSTLYSEPITINTAITIKAIAVKEGMDDSAILEAAYTITPAQQRLAKPDKPVLKSKRAAWTAVTDENNGYSVRLYKDNDYTSSVETGEIDHGDTLSYDFSAAMSGAGSYTVTVTARGTGAYSDSWESDPSDPQVVVDNGGKDGQAQLSAGTTGFELGDDATIDLQAGIETVDGNHIIIGGESHTLDAYNGGDLRDVNLTVPRNIGDQSVLVQQAVRLESGMEGEPVTITNSANSNVSVSIPDSTTIMAGNDWDGALIPPRVVEKAGTAPAGFAIGDTVIEVGSPSGILLFDKPVTLELKGVTGPVGYKPAGSAAWVQINPMPGGTYDDPMPPDFPGEAFITNGTDTKIITWHFTCFAGLIEGEDPDQTTLRIVKTDPADGARNVSRNKTITVTFNKDIEEGMFIGDITLKKGATVTDYVYGISDAVLTLDPTANLSYSGTYTVTIPAGAVEDQEGNPLADDCSFSFRIKSRPDRPDDRDDSSSDSEREPETIISAKVKTSDDQILNASLASSSGQAQINVGLNPDSIAKISVGVLEILAQNAKPLLITNNGIEVEFAPGTLLTDDVRQAGREAGAVLELGAREITSSEKERLLAQAGIGQSTGLFEIGGKIFDLTAQLKTSGGTEKIDSFPEPVAVTIDLFGLGELSEEEIAKLTGVRFEKDADSSIIPVKLGGSYDPATRTFTFYTDKFSLYSVLKSGKLAKISLALGEVKANVNGQTITAVIPPLLVNDRTMVPLRFIAESLGARVEWLEETRTVKITLKEKEILLAVDRTGPNQDDAIFIFNNVTLVPLRYVSETLGAHVRWFPSTRKIEIVR